LDLSQKIEIDTGAVFLEPTPMIETAREALEAHKDLEKTIKKGRINLFNDYYLLFRYRDTSFIKVWLQLITSNSENPLLKIWFINAVEQMGRSENLGYIACFNSSKNAIIRECAANAYGFLAPADSIPALRQWHAAEKNGYVRKTLEASIKAIQTGGYKNRFSYLPRYYKDKPLKLQFLYNRKINNDPEFQKYETDTGHRCVRTASFAFPFQQYEGKLKRAPKRGFFGSSRNSIFHVGVDAGWALEGVPVHAIADGIVKQVSHNLSWGSMVVVETISPASDTVCAIYGHLSRFINVNVGDLVKTGDKIGQIGNSVSYENGGYWAHLHLGIEKNSFNDAGISGYDRDTLNYENPIAFIKAHYLPPLGE
jgi:murein DD-endopeptidase MepM/ murein hydrolase activator NlpD